MPFETRHDFFADLGTAGHTKRPTSCVLIKPSKDEDTKEKYEEVAKKVKSMQVY